MSGTWSDLTGPTEEDRLRRELSEANIDRMVRPIRTLERLREAQSRLACAEPARRLDACTCWHGYEAAIRIVEESL